MKEGGATYSLHRMMENLLNRLLGCETIRGLKESISCVVDLHEFFTSFELLKIKKIKSALKKITGIPIIK